MTSERASLLGSVDVFRALEADALERLADAATARELAPGEVLFERGDAGDALFVVAAGALEAVLDERGTTRVLGSFAPGDHVGEMALLGAAARTATVRSVGAATVLRVDRAAFERVVAADPRVALAFAAVVSRRHGEITDALTRRHVALSVLVTDDPALGERVRASISRQLGKDTALVAADEGFDAPRLATARRGAAHLLVSCTPALAARHAALLERERTVAARARDARDVDRLARRLLGLSVGLALSGGAAQGLAHLGVVEALESAGIPVDVIAGTSGGALYGGLFATVGAREAQRRVLSHTSRGAFALADLTLPRRGVIRGRRIERILRDVFGEVTFDALPVGLHAVATDLDSGEPVVLDRGLVYRAVRASISVPGVFEPYVLEGRTLVDGGVVDPLPVSVARERGAAFVIAVLVPPPGRTSSQARARQIAGGHSLLSTFVRSYYFAGDVLAERAAALADVVIRPDVGGFGWREYRAGPAIVAEGRRAGEVAIPAILAALPLRIPARAVARPVR